MPFPVIPPGVHVTPEQFGTLRQWFPIFNVTSLVLAAVTTAVNLTSRKRRAFPSRLTTCFAAAATGFHAALVYSWASDYEHLEPPNKRLPHGSPCEIQGLFFAFFASCLSWWWFLISINLARTITLERTMAELKASEWVYHLFGWGAPLVQVVLLFIFRAVGTEEGALYCWISPRDHGAWKYGAFYAWLSVFYIVGLWYSFWIVKKLLHFHRRRVRTLKAEVQRARMSLPGMGNAVGAGGGRAASHHHQRSVEGSPSGYGSSATAASTRRRVSSAMSTQEGSVATSWFSYYVGRQVMFVLVLGIRWAVFLTWQINYSLWEQGMSSIPFWLCMVVEYFSGSIGLDVFLLIGLTRDNTNRLIQCCRRTKRLMRGGGWEDEDGSMAGPLLRAASGEGSLGVDDGDDDDEDEEGGLGAAGVLQGDALDDASTGSLESSRSVRGLAAMTPEPPKRHPILPAPDRRR